MRPCWATGVLHDPRRLRRVGEIGGNDRRGSSGRPYGGGNIFEFGFSPSDQGDIRSSESVSPSNARTYSPSCTGDEGDVAVETELVDSLIVERRSNGIGHSSTSKGHQL